MAVEARAEATASVTPHSSQSAAIVGVQADESQKYRMPTGGNADGRKGKDDHRERELVGNASIAEAFHAATVTRNARGNLFVEDVLDGFS